MVFRDYTWGRDFEAKRADSRRRHVQLREFVAGLAAGGFLLDHPVGPVQPTVLGLQEPLVFRKRLAVPVPRLESVVVPEEEQVAFQKAPPEDVQALLTVLLAEPRLFQEVLSVSFAVPVPQPVPISGKVVLPKGLRAHPGAPAPRLWSHGAPGGTQKLEGESQDEVAKPNPLSVK